MNIGTLFAWLNFTSLIYTSENNLGSIYRPKLFQVVQSTPNEIYHFYFSIYNFNFKSKLCE
jgi:hypothetical protein